MQGFDGAALDRWLTTDPREMSAAEEAAFERWCEANDVDLDADDAWDSFEEAMEDAREDAEIAAYEAREDARYDD